MRSLVIFLVFGLLVISYGYGAEEEESGNVPLFSDCVSYKGWAPLNSFQSQLTFFNECFMPVYIRVCVEDWRGDHKLYTSFQRVRTYGWIRMNIETSHKPKSIKYTYNHFLPDPPAPCKASDDSA